MQPKQKTIANFFAKTSTPDHAKLNKPCIALNITPVGKSITHDESLAIDSKPAVVDTELISNVKLDENKKGDKTKSVKRKKASSSLPPLNKKSKSAKNGELFNVIYNSFKTFCRSYLH